MKLAIATATRGELVVHTHRQNLTPGVRGGGGGVKCATPMVMMTFTLVRLSSPGRAIDFGSLEGQPSESLTASGRAAMALD